MLEELDHLAAHLQLRQVAMQVKPVQALQVQRNMIIQHVVDRDRHRPRDPDTMATSATWPMHGGCADLHRCVRGTQTSAVSGGACLEY